MKYVRHNASHWPLLTLLALVSALFAPALYGQDGPVAIDVTVNGDPAPGRQVTVRATIDIMDGSTLESVAWTQTGGLAANLSNADTANLRVRLGPLWRYRRVLFDVLREPPVGPGQLPPNVPFPEEAFPGGLPERWGVLGVSPFSIEEAGLVSLELTVTTSSGTYVEDVEIHTELPWRPTAGIRSVPIGVPVLINSKEQDTYDWQLTPPDGSNTSVSLSGRYPEFVPDIPGIYTLRVTDQAAGEPVEIVIYAGTWRGVIVDQDAEGLPVAEGLCTACHRSGFGPDQFTPWMETGHAAAFTDGLNTNSHFSTRCFTCHGVGYDPQIDNGGWDEAEDLQAFLADDLLGTPSPDNWTTMLDEYPAAAQLANIQCENCHGPQSSEPLLDTLAHGWRSDVEGEPRVSLASDVCATCHGEPLRHARFQQWQLSGHANYELAIEEGGSGNCSRCHTVNGFLEWLPVLLGEEEGDPLASIQVNWDEDETHPQTCVACHDPHDAGTTTGINTNARVRIAGSTPDLIAGFQVVGAGRAAVCMTCHNSRRGLRNEDNFAETKLTDAARAPHGSAQTDVLMGENAYLVNVGVRGRHSLIEDSCVTCHMEETPPPDVLSYNQGGTNHTFFASDEICQNCHTGLTADSLQTVVGAVMDHLKLAIEEALVDLMAEQIAAGNTLDFGGARTVADASDIGSVDFTEFRGRQAVIVTFSDGAVLGPFRMNDIDVVPPGPMAAMELYDVADDNLIKAGWNWSLIHNDGSMGAHNPTFALSVLDAARDALGVTGGPRAVLPPTF